MADFFVEKLLLAEEEVEVVKTNLEKFYKRQFIEKHQPLRHIQMDEKIINLTKALAETGFNFHYAYELSIGRQLTSTENLVIKIFENLLEVEPKKLLLIIKNMGAAYRHATIAHNLLGKRKTNV